MNIFAKRNMSKGGKKKENPGVTGWLLGVAVGQKEIDTEGI